jgi:hypothetical protein
MITALAAALLTQGPVPPGCSRGWFVSSGTHGLNISNTTRLIAGVRSGRQLAVRIFIPPGDSDSKPTEFWFSPTAVMILDDIVHAESAPLRWPPSSYSWTSDSTAVGTVSYRVASNGAVASVQGDQAARSEPRQVAWCLR